MSLADLASIASVISSLAVLISLAYVGYQIRQNTKHTRALIQSARVDRLMNQLVGFSDADKCAAYLAGNGQEPTAASVRERQFYMQCLAQVATISEVFTQHEDGLLSDEQFVAVRETYKIWLRQPGFRQVVKTMMQTSFSTSSKVKAFIESLLNETADAEQAPT